MRTFVVDPDQPTTWPGISAPARVVSEFLSRVRVTGDAAAARRLMCDPVRCHQVTADAPKTIVRTPTEYAAHVDDMIATFGRFQYTVTELISERQHVYVRWQQDGRHLLTDRGTAGTGLPLREVGSAVYRVEGVRIAEYWVQLDRLGLSNQLAEAQA